MANPQRGEVAFEAGGKTYTLKMTTNAICELEDLLSTPERQQTLPQIMQRVIGNDYRYLRAFIWAALRHFHPDVTLKGTGELIDEAGGMVKFSDNILQQLAASTQPEKDDVKAVKDDKGRPSKAQARKTLGIGDVSTPKLDKSA